MVTWYKFDMHVILNLTRDTVTTNGEGQILFENCQNRKSSDKNSPKQFLWIKLALPACIFEEE